MKLRDFWIYKQRKSGLVLGCALFPPNWISIPSISSNSILFFLRSSHFAYTQKGNMLSNTIPICTSTKPPSTPQTHQIGYLKPPNIHVDFSKGFILHISKEERITDYMTCTTPTTSMNHPYKCNNTLPFPFPPPLPVFPPPPNIQIDPFIPSKAKPQFRGNEVS